ncbi:MAG: hypothetical protein A2676_05015 [Candidatus Sungbacteria bacterium RIFCSPHIGHO2_01_FULL_51_22]|uniref:Uncharacterized protein n=1 Tax=Candidatus Sungbacteria bacterium RIFCSPHIGHO2_02_FULL_51_29 TaxID=1802273 RepID=A0A1G2KV89_9BACT|nr:MAG: hypothetical protein A2676_05015 [Candidatus Sungbacteria bacterium RIFCSPHIGHO2_01_FULL_51_22]OHA02329.1 MAG: hypothetical protein A3C16_04210 [Candidatus Sungbacteria bacterium RIFCSPHIGHO2_02_FULL_51_29]OHA05384.1 MAG: hypothetical protein A3B29_00805 [Candidatus Sungbacteria bacterium RIFCSPLOWO2_01_FULL_51_34]
MYIFVRRRHLTAASRVFSPFPITNHLLPIATTVIPALVAMRTARLFRKRDPHGDRFPVSFHGTPFRRKRFTSFLSDSRQKNFRR